jgi:hypothetical protein
MLRYWIKRNPNSMKAGYPTVSDTRKTSASVAAAGAVKALRYRWADFGRSA